MKYNKMHFAIDKTLKASIAKKTILRNYKNYYPKKSDVIVVIGGDGFMLETLKRYQKYNKPFYGINRGSFGFLMNKFRTKQLYQAINKAKQILITALEMTATIKNNNKKKLIAINEVSLLRQTKQTASLQIIKNNKIIIKRLLCDGFLVSTSAGSTAYNLSAHGPILPIDANVLTLTPISAFRPRRWRGAVLPEKACFTFKILEQDKRPVSATADFTEIREVSEVKVWQSKDLSKTLLFDPDHNLEERILREQFAS